MSFYSCWDGGTCLTADRLVVSQWNMFYVYAIRSINANYIYVGLTNNIERRINEHNKGYNKTTKSYSPFKLIVVEQFESRKDARGREKKLKSGVGKEYLRSLT
ncbi:GIY-YIG nuclease family protein [Catalinimonas sp. 4WD22]|uniref:GIY-YIG nuclease family protein n=1 Tax=Catalinimonas locisalis TaxID=3133978 RepID=UPI0031013576